MLIILFGLFVRVVGVSHKTFFQDEAYSALRITGHTEADYLKLRNGKVRPVGELAAFQQLDSMSSLSSTLKSIATEEPQRGPIFYSLATIWVEFFGTSIGSFRAVAVIVGLLVIGASYVFGRLLFGPGLGSLVFTALVGVSPFHVLYSQQAREYGMLTLAILLSASALVYAESRPNLRRFVLFGTSLVFGLFTSPFFALPIISYAAFLLIRNARTITRHRTLIGFAITNAVAGLIALPWYVYVLKSASQVGAQTSWGASVYPLKFYLFKLAFNFGAVFFDYEFADLRYSVVLVAVLVAIAYLAIRGIGAFPAAALLAICLAVPVLVVFIGNDVRQGAHFATIPRYLIPMWIAMELLVTTGLLHLLNQSTSRARFSSIALLSFLLVCGVFCAVGDARYTTWWTNNDNEPTEVVAREVNSRPKPIVLASNFAIALSLEHYVYPKTRFELYTEQGPPTLYHSGRPNMLFIPIEPELQEIRSANPAYKFDPLVEITRSNVAQFHKHLANARVAGGTFAEPSDIALWSVDKK